MDESDDRDTIDVTAAQPSGAKVEREVQLPDALSVLPLNNTVIFPATVTPVAVGKPRSLAAVEHAVGSNKLLVAVALRPGTDATDNAAQALYRVGTAVSILKLLRMPDGTLRILVQGLKRAHVEEITQADPFIVARLRFVEEASERTTEVEALMRNTLDTISRIISMVSYLPEELQSAAMSIEDPLMLVYLVSTLFRMRVEDKQEILELESVEAKYRKLLEVLNRELDILELGGKIKSEVQQEMTKSQREYYLREQLKAIQQELGEADETQAEINEITGKLKALDLPEEVRKEAERELARLGKIPPISPEHQVIRSYLQWIMELPWNVSTEDNLDLERARRILDDDHYDLDKIKERIVEYLAVRKLKADMRGPILCFIGPPGTGKTSLGQSIARALGRKFIRMSLGGMRDEAEIRGHRRTYIGALPGRVLQGIRRAASNNPVFMLDEIDKVGADFRGDPSSALLEVLDAAQNNTFRDHYLDLAFDLSKVLFITTGNVTQTIQPALRDRMEVITLSGYTTEEKVHIAEQYLIPRQLAENGLEPKALAFDRKAIVAIIDRYTREAGVRNVEREIGTICRKVAYAFATGRTKQVRIRERDIDDYLGPQKVYRDVAQRTSMPGVATGLAWTESGGDVLFVEAVMLPGAKSLILTGHLGDVMQESARAALSCVRSLARKFGVDPRFFDRCDIHLHVPAGAIPKDGPSAGITMATAIASVLTGQPIDKDVAMSGEITLSGQILPVGGVKEKVLAAKRAGIKRVILPKRNERDVEEIDKNLRRGLDFVFAGQLEEVFKAALTNQRRRSKSGQGTKPRKTRAKSARSPRRTKRRS